MNSLPRELNHVTEFGDDSPTGVTEVRPDTGGTDELSQNVPVPQMGYWHGTADVQTVFPQMQLVMLAPVSPTCMNFQIAPAAAGMMHSGIENVYNTCFYQTQAGVTSGAVSGISQSYPDYMTVPTYMGLGSVRPRFFPESGTVPSYTMIGSATFQPFPENNNTMIGSSGPPFPDVMYSGMENPYLPSFSRMQEGITSGTASGISQSFPDYGRVPGYMDIGSVAPPSFPTHGAVPNYVVTGPVHSPAFPENETSMIGSWGPSFPLNAAAHDRTMFASARGEQVQSSPIGLAKATLEASSCGPGGKLAPEAKVEEVEEIPRSSCAEMIAMLLEEENEDPLERVAFSLAVDDTCDAPDWNDSCSFVSSDASTVVSRSARRRRGRRAAKARATQAALSTIPISESPALDDICVTAEMKTALTQQLEAGGLDRLKALSKIRGSVCSMAFEPFGCRVIQMAFDVASVSDQQLLVAELHGCIHEAVSSPHANFVIQKVIEVLPVQHTEFIAEELLIFAAEVARHRYGCRIMCRLVEHSNATSSRLIDNLLLEVENLINHNFARHVIETVIEHGSRDQKQRIVRAIRNDFLQNAKCRYASYVVEQVLSRCEVPERDALASDLVSDLDCFLALACHECGSHVIKALLRSRDRFAARAKELLVGSVAQIRTSKFGQRLLNDVE